MNWSFRYLFPEWNDRAKHTESGVGRHMHIELAAIASKLDRVLQRPDRVFGCAGIFSTRRGWAIYLVFILRHPIHDDTGLISPTASIKNPFSFYSI